MSQMGQDQGVITQGTMYLKPFDCEVSLLHTPDGDFVPLVELCNMLGVPVAPYTAMACKRFRSEGEGALQRLPFGVSPESPAHQVWCLRDEEVLFWLKSIPSDRVSLARREQQRASRLEMMRIANDVYNTMQEQFRETYSELFDWMRLYNDMSARFQRIASRAALQLDPEERDELALLMAHGHALFEKCTELTQSTLQEAERQPLVDIPVVNDVGEVVDVHPLPVLLPVLVSEPPLRQAQARLVTWVHELEAFLTAHFPPDEPST